jgi:hypothetical protein
MPTAAILATVLTLSSSWQASPAETAIFTRRAAILARQWELRPDLGVTAVDAEGRGATIESSEVLAVVCRRGAVPASPHPLVRLQNGEVIAAGLGAKQSGDRAIFDSALWRRLEIPLGRIAVFSRGPTEARAGQLGQRGENEATKSPGPPCVLLENGDAIAARVERMDPEELTVHSEFGETRIPMTRIAAAVLAGKPPPADGRRGETFLIELGDGQRFHCHGIAAAAQGGLALRRDGARCQVDRRAVRRIIWPGAAIEYASALRWTADGRGYFGNAVAVRRDRNARGRPLRLGRRVFQRGFGVRPRSRVLVQAAKRWLFLEGEVGLDPWLGRSGQCEVRVTAGDRRVFQGELGGQARSRRLLLQVHRAGQIGLHADFGARGDLGDFVNWCELSLLGERREGGG